MTTEKQTSEASSAEPVCPDQSPMPAGCDGKGSREAATRAWVARPSPGNVEAAATIYYADDSDGATIVGGCPVADIYDPAAVSLMEAAPRMLDALKACRDLFSAYVDAEQITRDELRAHYLACTAISKAEGSR